MGRAVRPGRFRIGARFFEQLRHLIEARITLALEILVRSRRSRRRAECAAATTSAAAQRRKLESDPDGGSHRALFPCEPVEIHHGDLPSQHAAGWNDGHGGDAVRARHWNGIGLDVERDLLF